ncbi:carbohydrate ABC transporter permease [Actinoplanes couchii]|uniref:Sugar ABC transporter permease n=1 Tax=Actinoplanes couchii TaxID=403638 RepID=A0ABQ3XRT4_9ACTN|nr:carbohydrate ABC transporter permease [Actinoplanes couchii]MDR6318467.1 raffinose/stachyose/melibiose transport system permease protein [Actinoplanes couchii]GID61224.1 sugar ABC transporter permease [Actinoplanes couchii]
MTSIAPGTALTGPRITDAGPSRNTPKPKGGIGTTIVVALVALLWISPLALLVTTAVRPLSDFVSHGPLSWPGAFTFENFADAWGIGNFATTYRNSTILLMLKVPLGVFVSAMLAYALAKLRIWFGAAIMYIVFLGLTIPIYITIVPVFVMARSAGITDSLIGLIGPYLAFGIPFEVLVLQAFIRQIPDEIIEAAKIDGAGPWRIFLTVVLPLSVPALVTVFILDAVATWNEFLFALIMLNSDASKTIPVGLLNFQGQFANNSTGLAAGILIAVVPILIAYTFLQRWIVGGLTAGASKG